jgi:hypothetical protein
MLAVLKLQGLLPESWSSILLLIARARQVARFPCHGLLYAWIRAATSGAMADSDAQLFGATDHAPDLPENSAQVTRDCQRETKLWPIFILYFLVHKVYGTGQMPNYSDTENKRCYRFPLFKMSTSAQNFVTLFYGTGQMPNYSDTENKRCYHFPLFKMSTSAQNFVTLFYGTGQMPNYSDTENKRCYHFPLFKMSTSAQSFVTLFLRYRANA